MTRRSWNAVASLAVVVVVGIIGACTSAGATPSTTPGGGNGCPTSQPAALAAGETRTVTMGTELGDMVIKVEADLSPIAVGNFVTLAECGFYDGIGFHRVLPGFVIQGGDPTGNGGGGPGYDIIDEPVTATYARGVLAMARSPQPNSQGSQFFIILDDSAAFSLEQANNYAIMGTVTSGMEVADAIAAAADRELPSNPIVITNVSVGNP